MLPDLGRKCEKVWARMGAGQGGGGCAGPCWLGYKWGVCAAVGSLCSMLIFVVNRSGCTTALSLTSICPHLYTESRGTPLFSTGPDPGCPVCSSPPSPLATLLPGPCRCCHPTTGFAWLTSPTEQHGGEVRTESHDGLHPQPGVQGCLPHLWHGEDRRMPLAAGLLPIRGRPRPVEPCRRTQGRGQLEEWMVRGFDDGGSCHDGHDDG